MAATSVIARAANGVLRTFLAPTCAACGVDLDEPLTSPVCGSCWRDVPALTPPYCVRCGDALASTLTAGPLCARCRRHAPVVTLARSAGRYDGSLRQIVHAFKYDGCRVLAAPLAILMQQASDGVLDGVDAVVPVPLHPWRAWQRGFNQADDLARALAGALEVPVWRMLRRARHGPPQASLPAAQRHANVRTAYALRRDLAAHVVSRIVVTADWPERRARNRVVVLVDDVMTTGATLEACGRVLLTAGVRSVRALTVARAVATRPSRPRPPLHPETARR